MNQVYKLHDNDELDAMVREMKLEARLKQAEQLISMAATSGAFNTPLGKKMVKKFFEGVK